MVKENFQVSLKIRFREKANVSVFNNKDLLSNMRNAPLPMNISGIDSNSKALVSTQIGDFTPLGITAYYQPQAAANVLCFYDLNSVCAVVFDPTANQYSVTNPNIGDEFVFTTVSDPSDPSHKLYLCSVLDQLNSPLTGVAQVTVSQLDAPAAALADAHGHPPIAGAPAAALADAHGHPPIACAAAAALEDAR